MSDLLSLLHQVDRVCAQITGAMHSAELHTYATLSLLLLLTVLIFPPRNDLDQI